MHRYLVRVLLVSMLLLLPASPAHGAPGVPALVSLPEPYAVWSPDGRYLVYGKRADLFLHDAQTGQDRNLTNTPDRWELMPTWSPRGDTIAFVSRSLDPREGRPAKAGADPWVMQGCWCGAPTVVRLDGTGYRILEEVVSHNPPSWSPDGDQLAYQEGGEVHLYTLQSGQVRVVTGQAFGLEPFTVAAPSWSPTGKELAVFIAAKEGGEPRESSHVTQGYALLDLAQKRGRIIYEYQGPYVYRPPALWSRDGKRLALVFRQETRIDQPLGLVVVNRASGQTEVVSRRVYQAAWEPGGDRLAFLGEGGGRQIRLLTPAGSGWRSQVFEFGEPVEGFAWRPQQ